MLRVTIHGTKELKLYFRRLARRIPNQTNKASKQIANRIKQKAQNNIKSRVRWEWTGNLAGSFMLQKLGMYAYRLINTSPYAAYVEHGTKPHLIRNPLGYTWRGPDYGKSYSETGGYYRHPGSRAMNFLSDAAFGVFNTEANKIISRRADIAMR